MKLNVLREWLDWVKVSSSSTSSDTDYLRQQQQRERNEQQEEAYSYEFYSTFDIDIYDDSNSKSNSVSFESSTPYKRNRSSHGRIFEPAKKLCERDNIIIDMLNSASTGKRGCTAVSFCITDPSLPDNPVIFVSDGFSDLTGYEFEEIVGRNCRFLQGPETDRGDVEKITRAIKEETECSVNLLNYRKDGTVFRNEQVVYYIGIQAAVGVNEEGKETTLCVTDLMPSNPGCKYSI